MATWGTGPFDNDDADDFAAELLEHNDLTPARAALSATMDRDDWLEIPEGARAVAAALVVAASLDGDVAGVPDDVAGWLDGHPDAASLADARLAMDALLRVAGQDSELGTEWLVELEAAAWVEQVGRLGYRLARVVGTEAVP